VIELLNIDCMEYMATQPADSFDFVITSPPYDSLRDYGGGEWNEDKWRAIIAELARLLSPGGVIVWVVSDATVKGGETLTSFKQALCFVENGLLLHDTMVWSKPNPIPRSHRRYEQAFEYMFVASNGPPATWVPVKTKAIHAGQLRSGSIQKSTNGVRSEKTNTGVIAAEKVEANVWNIANNSRTDHPAAFPLVLVERHISTWCKKGQRVLDPFLGSGTSAIAAHNFGADFVGCELDEDYYNAAKHRVDMETRQMSLID
jgi:DNA modification methylase